MSKHRKEKIQKSYYSVNCKSINTNNKKNNNIIHISRGNHTTFFVQFEINLHE